MKNAMKKQSPMKQTTLGATLKSGKDAAMMAVKKKIAAKKDMASQPGKPNATTVKAKATKSTTKTPAMQMKKAGKKC